MSQHRPRGVDGEIDSPRGHVPTRDRSRAGAHVQHDPSGQCRCARQQSIGQRPVHQLSAVSPRRCRALVALQREAQGMRRGHASHARAAAT